MNERVPLPYPHFMGFAPLDCWARVLIGRGAIRRISPRYWLRLAGVLATSSLATVLTLPERLVMAGVLARGGRRAERLEADAGGPEVVVVLGYYRSGTTHLHYLLSCDRRMVTPRWYQALAPQGFAGSWTFLRFFLVPFLSSTRPQDDVAYGPEYPAEDDFAVCNWTGACAMPGRMVLPGEWARYARLHGLSAREGASAAERGLFARTQWAFTRKVAMLNPGRRILLKTPSHTARVEMLRAIYGERVRFIHLSREAGAVMASNVAMHARFAPFLLQPHPGDAEIERRVVEEYDATERAFVSAAGELEREAADGTVRLVRMRYEDLIADPIGELRGAYERLGMEWTAEYERAVRAYLVSVQGYRTASQRAKADAKSASHAVSAGAMARLSWMHEAFGHDRPARAKVEIGAEAASAGGTGGAGRPGGRHRLAVAAGVVMALVWVGVWLAWAQVGKARADALIWPAGLAVGLTMLRVAGRGTMRLGLIAAGLTLGAYLTAAMPSTLIAEYLHHRRTPWYHVWLSTYRGVLAMNNLFWVVLGLVTAYRFGSRQHVRPPGM